MEKKSLNKKTKITCIICIVALLCSLYGQFIAGWHYTGIKKDALTSEERAIEMKASISNLVWNPYEEETKSLMDFLDDPSLKYSEELTIEKLDEDQVVALGKVFDGSYADEEEEVEAATEDAATAETTEEVTENTEAVAEENNKADEDEAEEETKEEEAKEEINGDVTYKAMLVSIIEEHINAAKGSSENKEKTVLAKSKDSKAALVNYEEYMKVNNSSNKQEEIAFFNGMVSLPAILFVAELLFIGLIIFYMRKGKGAMLASIATFVIGVLNLFYIYSQPIFLLWNAKNFNTLAIIMSLVTFIGFILIMSNIKFKTAKSGVISAIKPVTYQLLIDGIVLVVIRVIMSFLFVGANYDKFNVKFIPNILSLIILALGLLYLIRNIATGINDKIIDKRAGK